MVSIRTFLHLLPLFILLNSSSAFCWGERGHNIVGYSAAILLSDTLTNSDNELIGNSFRVRAFQMGHLSNIPDFSWKDPRKDFNKELNSTTHHFSAEKLLGNLAPSALAEKIRTLDTDLKKIKETYPNFEMSVGTAPWRIQELYNKIVEAYKCTKGKTDNKDRKSFKDPFNNIYNCSGKTTWNEDLYAAFVYSGLLGHFIGDLSQPQHTTSNFDGQIEGQTGSHLYFETLLLENYDQNLLSDVINKAKSTQFQKKVWSKLKVDFAKINAPTQLTFNLVADSTVLNSKVLELDRKYALIKKGDKPTRKPPNDPVVLKQNRSFIIERLATSVILLSKLWLQAWEDAGKPNISDFGYLSAPYPQEVPFLKPNYYL